MPLVIEDALKVGFTQDKRLVKKFLKLVDDHLIALAYHKRIPIQLQGKNSLSIRLGRAGHIFGSAFCQCKVKTKNNGHDILFSGDLGAPYTPLLPAPEQPYGCDTLILESTYGNKIHEHRRERQKTLGTLLKQSLKDGGTVLIPAFSIGRTQELLYELESFLHANRSNKKWHNLQIILDSPMAIRVTETYKNLRPWWDKEAHARIRQGRKPLSFRNIQEISDHKTHQRKVKELSESHQPAVVIAASGMCSGGRIMNYLEAMLNNTRHNVLFVGYQASGTPGRTIQKYGPHGGYVHLNDQKIKIKAGIHTIPGYSAHADQKGLFNFIKRMRKKPQQVILVHGDTQAKQTLKKKITDSFNIEVLIPV